MGSAVSSALSVVGSALVTVGVYTLNPMMVVAGAVMVAGATSLAPTPDIPSFDNEAFQQQLRNQNLMIKQPITTRETVYGSTKKSGSIVFMDTSDNNKRLHLILQIASHELQSFDKIYFDNEELTLTTINTDSNGIARQRPTSPDKYDKQSDFEGLPLAIIYTRQAVEIKEHLGADTQLADHDLIDQVSKWTTEHRLRGIAYVYVQLDYDADMFPNGIPNISAEIKGKKLFDFRDDSTAFSDNPALCIYDYLTDTRLGLGISRDNIDTASFTTMANLCDENVTKVGGGTEKRYTCNGVVYSNRTPMQTLNSLLTSCLGVLSYSNGKFIIKGGQYVSPSITLTDDDFISSIAIESKRSRRDLFNTVKGVFTSEETNWQPSDYPMVTSSTFTDADGESIYANINLPFTTSSATCQRIAKVSLFKNRQQIVISGQVKMTGFKLQVGDTVSVTNARLGFSSKQFEVAEWSFAHDNNLAINLILNETSSAVYDWNAEESEFALDNTTLPTPQDVSPPAIVVTDELRIYAETPITVMKVVCSSSSGFTNEFEVEAQNTNDTGSDFVTLGRSKGNIFELVNAQDGAIYNVRARSINGFNVHSSFTTTTHEVIGKTAPPADVTNFSSNVVGDIVHLNWTPVADLDLSHYIIRHTPLTSNTKFEEGLIVAKKIGKPANTITLPAQTGTYMIKAIDVLGIESENSTKTAIIKNAISRDFNVVATSTQSPNFTGGTMGTDLEVVTRDTVKYLQLIEGVLFDDASGNFDDMTGNFDSGGTATFNSEGVYDFPIFDLGGVYNSRVNFTCKFNRFDTASLFDSFLGTFDSQTGNFEGGYTEHNDLNVELLIATSTDGTNYNDYRTYVLGDYTASHIKLRVRLSCDVDTVTPAIYELSATVDMPDRTTGEEDIASGTASGGKAVTFSPAFKELQALGISLQNLDQNEHYVISNKSATGFTITIYQGSGTSNVVDRTFDYVAKGYGYVESA
jgi:hypothetical protein